MNLHGFKKTIKEIDGKLYYLLSSTKFFYATLLFFAIISAWVATASLYPMAFDENVHMGIIDIYARQLTPLLTQTKEMAQYGGVVGDPSYLFHYLMSFPYRFERDVLQLSETASIIGLRFLNIGMFVAGLAVFWKSLAYLNLSRFTRNLIIALVCLIPISPLIAGQVNYDNLLILGIATCFLFALRIINSIVRNKRIAVIDMSMLTSAILFTSATKYAFLPIALAIVATLFGTFILSKQKSKITKSLVDDFKKISNPLRLLLMLILVICVLLNYRYVDNVTNHQSVAPKCDTFFSQQECRSFGPYGRTYDYRQNVADNFEPKSIVAFTAEDWVPGMTLRLFFAVAGPTNDYDTRQPVVLTQVIYIIGISVGIATFIIMFGLRKLWRDPRVWLIISMIVIYCMALIGQVYSGYTTTGIPAALNGRYLIPLAPIIGAVAILGISGVKKGKKAAVGLGIAAALLLLLILVQGGGIVTYVVQGQSEWFWSGWGQESHSVLKNILEPIVLK